MISGRVFAQDNDAAANAAPSAAAAENYIEDHPVDEDQKKNQAAIGSILRTGTFADDQKKNDFDTYYKTYALSRWTKLNTLGSIRAYRKELSNNLVQARNSLVHDHLNDLVLDYMSKRAKDNYHPAVRYNAMLAIGELNAVEGPPPKPLETALPILLAAVNDDNQIEPVKIAALIGINRHVSTGVSNAQTQNQILTMMLKLAAGGDPAKGSDVGRDWMRMQAAEILGLLGMTGNNNQVVQTLSGIVRDAGATFLTRCAAAEALGKLKYAGASGLNAADLAKALGQLMAEACQAELKNVKNSNMPVSRRRMKTCLNAVLDSLKGVKPLAKDPSPQLTYLNELQAIFTDRKDGLDKDLDNAELEDEELQKSVERCQNKLKKWLEKKI